MYDQFHSFDEIFDLAVSKSSESTNWTCPAVHGCDKLLEINTDPREESMIVAGWAWEHPFFPTFSVLDLLRIPGYPGRLIFHNVIHEFGWTEVHGWLPDGVWQDYERRLQALEVVFARNGDSPNSGLVNYLPSHISPESDALTLEDLCELFFLACTDTKQTAALSEYCARPASGSYRDSPEVYDHFVLQLWPLVTSAPAPQPGLTMAQFLEFMVIPEPIED